MEEKVPPSNKALDDVGATKEPQPATIAGHKRWRLLLVGALFLLIVLALALGLGLGLGLKNRDHSALAAAPSSTLVVSTTPNPTATSSPSSTPAPLQDWRLDTLEYNLDLSWNISAPPTTRIFNLTLSEIEAAPDGEFLHKTLVR
jgi:hypothetical protein